MASFDAAIVLGPNGHLEAANDAAISLFNTKTQAKPRLSQLITDAKERRRFAQMVKQGDAGEFLVSLGRRGQYRARSRAIDAKHQLIVLRPQLSAVSLDELAAKMPIPCTIKRGPDDVIGWNAAYADLDLVEDPKADAAWRNGRFDPDTADEQARLDDQAISKQEALRLEHAWSSRGGSKDVFRITRVPLRPIEGDEPLLFTMIEEITENLETPGGLSVDAGLIKAILDYMPGLLSLKDAKTRRFLFATGMDRVLSGGNRDMLIGKGAKDLYSAEMARRIDDAESGLLEKPDQVIENQFSNLVDGKERHFYSRKLVVPDTESRPRYILTFNLDITAQIAAQRALDETNAFLDAVIDYIPALVSVKSFDDGCIVRANRRFCEFLDFEPDAIMGKRLEQVNQELATQLQGAEECLHDDPSSVIEGEVSIITTEGERWLNTHTVAIPGPDGKPSHIISIHQDITDRVRAEKELAENRTFLSTIIQQLPLALSVKDASSRRVLLQNEGAAGFLPGGRSTGVAGSFLASPDPKLQNQIERLDESVLRNARGVIEVELKTPVDGKERWGHVKKVRINDRSGAARYILTLFEDITERRETLEDLRLSEATLKRSQTIASIGSWHADLESGEMEWSDQMFPLLGWESSRDTPSLATMLGRIVADDRRRLEAARAKATRSRTDRYGMVVRVQRDDLQLRHMRIDGEIERDRFGEAVAIVGTCQDVTERVEAEAHIRHLAQHDGLTGLPNRLLFDDRLQQAVRHARRTNGKLAVLCLDLNDFKGVNDTLGHAAGDELLRQVSARLQNQLRECDTVARLGGDEFAIIQDGLESETLASLLADRVLLELAAPYRVADQEVYTSASIGIAVGTGQAVDPKELLQQADMALYDAKAAGRSSFRYFSPDLNRALRQRRDIEGRLRVGLEQNQLTLAYQPQFCLRTGGIIGAEALLRWTDSELGPVRPDQFIPVAEESGQILQIGEFVLREACAQAEAWRVAGYRVDRMAVNLSPAQFAYQDLAEMVANILRVTGLPASCLELEITESTLMRDRNGAVKTLQSLHALGVTLALDDFGIGYSSLSYLKRFPLDKLKIDRSFVTDIPNDPDDVAIARTIMSLGKTLGLTVLAEGVETVEQRDFLLQEGCDEVQGFLYARPMPADEVEAMLKQHQKLRIAS
ncbi:MAG: EAL domain-containing protein [Pseudomonadota bacterium]